MKKFDNDVFHGKYIKHLAWLDGYAGTWEGWQMSACGYEVTFKFFEKNLREADFSFSAINNSVFKQCGMEFIKLNSATLKNTRIDYCKMRSCSSYCSFLSDVLIMNSELSGTDFRFADFKDVSFMYNTMRNCDFSYSTFDEGCDIRFNDITGANFTGTRFDFKNYDGLVPFCYAVNREGHTVLISDIDKKVYDMPYNFAGLSAERLNKAINVSESMQKDMYNEYMTGFTGKSYVKTSYKARFRLLNGDTEIYSYDTEIFTNKDKFDKFINELTDAEIKKNPKKNIQIILYRKTDNEYEVFDEIYAGKNEQTKK